MIRRERKGDSTAYLNDEGALLAHVYCDDGMWYAVDADGNDLPNGWHHDTRQDAERGAEQDLGVIA